MRTRDISRRLYSVGRSLTPPPALCFSLEHSPSSLLVAILHQKQDNRAKEREMTFTASLLSTASRRLLARRGGCSALLTASSRQGGVVAAAAATTANARRSLSATADFSQFQEQGIVDSDNLIKFDTLHEMQTRSCLVYEKRELFGTFSNKSNQFEWMTFKEYGDKVDQCRAMLKDLGE